MRLGTVTAPPAVRSASRLDAAQSVTPVRRITPDWIDEDPLDELTQSDRALLLHLYGGTGAEDDGSGGARVGEAPVADLAREINRERRAGSVSGRRDLTAEDLRRILGRLTVTAREPVPVELQVRLMTILSGTSGGHLDVVL
ncbi:hypothetical protein GTQ99_15055 [Kineococcus sp. T13]|uniref:hypothetical protein n=1 Tax=Kineococcus vitellinus TaxID=2696565 RepID=UPI001412DE1E|nr:hypothetical protein [Kineococcus vitellinus]NAZ76729.1 hypothetical protein [Kineococcus vitellinus]